MEGGGLHADGSLRRPKGLNTRHTDRDSRCTTNGQRKIGPWAPNPNSIRKQRVLRNTRMRYRRCGESCRRGTIHRQRGGFSVGEGGFTVRG
eukprot:9180537-Pyramimonas_sp.AAC.2